MLNGSFFSIIKSERQDHSILAELKLDPLHPLYNGHFPDQPVVPGVCLIQMIKELLESSLSRQLLLASARQVKFIAPIDPNTAPLLQASVTWHPNGESLPFSASISADEKICCKMNGVFRIIQQPGGSPV